MKIMTIRLPATSWLFLGVAYRFAFAHICAIHGVADAFVVHNSNSNSNYRVHHTREYCNLQPSALFPVPSFSVTMLDALPNFPRQFPQKFSRVCRMMSSSSPSNNNNDNENDDNNTDKKNGISSSSAKLFFFTSNDEGVPFFPWDRPVLSTIDAVSLLIFAGIGKASHSAVDGSIDMGAVLVTAVPFLVSWFLLSPWVGCFTPEATQDVPAAAVQAAKGWIVAVPVALLLRAIIKGYVPPLPFVIVTLLATLVILSIGRVGYTVLSELYVEMF
mmetsp:Transcript_61145/g.70301  ORF Transcript_61145/g.70301 Transcript_61145/m.70301 type:complete len:273 (-) Transcript_61145:60-878(-)